MTNAKRPEPSIDAALSLMASWRARSSESTYISNSIGLSLEVANFAKLDADRLPPAIRAQVSLHHERLSSLADYHEEAGQLRITNETVPG